MKWETSECRFFLKSTTKNHSVSIALFDTHPFRLLAKFKCTAEVFGTTIKDVFLSEGYYNWRLRVTKKGLICMQHEEHHLCVRLEGHHRGKPVGLFCFAHFFQNCAIGTNVSLESLSSVEGNFLVQLIKSFLLRHP
jgi:hypothetical protein